MENQNIPVETYNQWLIDIMQGNNFQVNMLSNFKKFTHDKKTDTLIINFILFIFYTTDKVTIYSINKGFSPKEQEYYHKLLLIEDFIKDCMVSLGREDLLIKAVDLYAKYTPNA